jgi:antitoxin PrlF
MATTLTSKGQVTIPKAIRDHLGLKPGHKVAFVADRQGRVVVEAVNAPKRATRSRFAALRGAADTGMTTDQILALTRGGR